jgi:parallel beta-helix repeat protein
MKLISNDPIPTPTVSSTVLTYNGSAIVWAANSTGTVIVQEGDVTVDAAATTLDFDASDFTITSSPSGEANITLAYGTSAGTPAEGNHAHAGVYAAASHAHAASDVTSGTMATARLGSGSASSSTYLRGDQTWAAVSSSSPFPYDVTASPYNATGDGVTDDSSAINAAITAANAAGGGVVLFPEATYIVQNITLKSNVILRGMGYGTILKLKASTTADVIKTSGVSDATKITFSGVEHMTIDGNKANQSAGVDLQQFGVALQFATDCWVDRCWVKNTQRSGIYFSGSRNMVTNCHLSGIGNAGAAGSIIGRTGIAFNTDGTNAPVGSIAKNNRVLSCLEHGIKVYPGGHNSQINGNYILAAADRGIYFQGCNYCTANDNTIDGAGVNGIFFGENASAGIGNVATGNAINGTLVGASGGHGILFWSQTGCTISGNQVSGSYGNGIYILDSSAYTVTGNRCHGNGTNGVAGGVTLYQSPNGVVSGNVISNTGTVGSRGYGIWAWDAGTATTHVVVTGNRCFDTGAGAAKVQSYGLFTDVLSNYFSLANNDLADNFTGTYSMVGANNSILSAPHTQITLGPFYLNDVQGTASPQLLTLGYFNTATAVSQDSANLLKAPAACKAVALMLISDADWTAGTADLYISVNGAAGTSINGNLVRLSTTNRETHYYATTHDNGLSFAAGNTIQLQVETVGWTPTTANFTAWVTISLD